MVLQQMHDLTDEETIYQYAFNIQWHYALNITDDAYISLKTLWNMRHLLTGHDLYTAVFENIANTLAKTFSVGTSLQRIDSVHIFSNMRHLGRISLFVPTIKFILNLKRHHKNLFDSLEKELTDRYLSGKEKSVFSMVKPSESAKTLQSLGDDLFFLIERFKDNKDVSSMSSYKLLLRLLHAIEDTEKRSLKPKEIVADSLYGGDENCEEAKAQNVDVLSPVMGRASAKEITLADFVLSGSTVTACPEGHAPVFHKHKKGRYTAAFNSDACPGRTQCPVKPGKQGCYLRYDEKAIRSAKRRHYEKTPELREKYRFRSGIEGTMSYCERKTGIKQGVRGLPAVSFCATLKAAAVNILRAAAFMKRKNTAPNTGEGVCSSLLGRVCTVIAGFFFTTRGNMMKDLWSMGAWIGNCPPGGCVTFYEGVKQNWLVTLTPLSFISRRVFSDVSLATPLQRFSISTTL